MGWSYDLIRSQVKKIFGGDNFLVDIPEATRPYVRISYEKEISIEKKRRLAELFPADWYIYFHPDTHVAE